MSRDPLARCKTCEHWVPAPKGERQTLRGAGECMKAPQIWDATDVHEEDDGFTEYRTLKPEHAAVLAVVEDGSAYRARLVTMPDFGCVQHERSS